MSERAKQLTEYSGELHRFLTGVLRNPDLASDVLQAAILKAVESQDAIPHSALKSWLFRVAYNEALARRRRDAVHERAISEIAHNRAESLVLPEDEAINAERRDVIHAALRELPQEQLDVVRLRVFEGKKFAEIAGECGLPLGTVLTRMKLALAKLRRKLGSED